MMGRSGQGTVEYMLVISVIVIAMVAALWAFAPDWNEAMSDLADGAETVYTRGTIAN